MSTKGLVESLANNDEFLSDMDKGLSLIFDVCGDGSPDKYDRAVEIFDKYKDDVLPYLSEHFLSKISDDYTEAYYSARLIERYATEESLNTVLDLLSTSRYSQSSSINYERISMAVNDIAMSIRRNNPSDSRLDDIVAVYEKGFYDRKTPADSTTAAITLAVCGTSRAKVFIGKQISLGSLSLVEISDILLSIEDPEKVTEAYYTRYEGNQISMGTSIEFSTELPRVKTQLLAYLSTLPDISVTSTCIQLVNLASYICMKEQGSVDIDFSSSVHINRLVRAIKAENDAEKKGDIIPTVGIEIEIPYNYLSRKQAHEIGQIGFSTMTSIDSYFEVRSGYSYSWQVQARFLEDITKLNVFALDEKKFMSKDGDVSMHINVGIPFDLSGDKDHYTLQHEAYFLSDALVYGYTSSGRVVRRKTHESVLVKYDDVDETEKNQSLFQTKRKAARLELRAGEFRDFPTFEAVQRAQYASACMLSYCRCKLGKPFDEVDEAYAKLWVAFKSEMQAFLDEYVGGKVNRVDADKVSTIVGTVIDDKKPKEGVRKILHACASGALALSNEAVED